MQLTPHQSTIFNQLKQFINSTDEQVFILRGYAGTGKTTLVGFLLHWLSDSNSKCSPVVLASTGRAARILKQKTKVEARTIHSHIYSFSVIDEQEAKNKDAWKSNTGQLVLNFDLKISPGTEANNLYIIDEASMLSYQEQEGDSIARFGSGNVLSDFLQFAGQSKVIFVGDPAQLPPPVGINPFSAALAPNYLSKTFNKKVVVGSLTEILRQKEGAYILQLATGIRHHIKTRQHDTWEEIMGQSGRGIFHPFNQQVLFKKISSLTERGYPKTNHHYSLQQASILSQSKYPRIAWA